MKSFSCRRTEQNFQQYSRHQRHLAATRYRGPPYAVTLDMTVAILLVSPIASRRIPTSDTKTRLCEYVSPKDVCGF